MNLVPLEPLSEADGTVVGLEKIFPDGMSLILTTHTRIHTHHLTIITLPSSGEFNLAMSSADLAKHAKMQTWFRQGRKASLKDVPHPTDSNGRKLPHGAKLDFVSVPIKFHPRRALIWWLRLRHMNIPGDYPLQQFVNEHGGIEPGLVQLVELVLKAKENAPCMTLEEVR